MLRLAITYATSVGFIPAHMPAGPARCATLNATILDFAAHVRAASRLA